MASTLVHFCALNSNAKLSLHSHFTCRRERCSALRQRSAVKEAKTSVRIRVVAQKLDAYKVLRTIWKVGNDGIRAGTKLVPESVPRPVAQLGVAVIGLVAISFALKSVLSTALFILVIFWS